MQHALFKKFHSYFLFHFYFLFQAVFYAINIFYSILIFEFCFLFIPACYSLPIDWFLWCGSTFNDQPSAKVRRRATDWYLETLAVCSTPEYGHLSEAAGK